VSVELLEFLTFELEDQFFSVASKLPVSKIAFDGIKLPHKAIDIVTPWCHGLKVGRRFNEKPRPFCKAGNCLLWVQNNGVL